MLLAASALDVTALAVQSLTAIAAVVLAYVALRITAKPGVRVNVDRDGGPAVFTPGEEAALTIRVELRGFFYGKPTATNTKITVNVEQSWGLERLSWTAPGRCESQEVAHGKGLRASPWWSLRHKVPRTGPSDFLVADRLWLTRNEQPETLYATVIAPDRPGRHFGWVHARADEGDCGVHVFALECR